MWAELKGIQDNNSHYINTIARMKELMNSLLEVAGFCTK